MRIEIFVVLTEIKRSNCPRLRWSDLEVEKAKLTREFGGLTQTGEEKGYWNDNGEICVDTVERWLIYTASTDCFEIIESFAKRIKEITAQRSQVFGIDGKLFSV
jgi:hypothetical protein